MHKNRVVIDTNVLVSGIIQRRGFPYKIVKSWEDGDLMLVTSAALIEEAERVLNYPKIRQRYGLSDDEIKQAVLNLARYSVLVTDPPSVNAIEEDPTDNNILAAAIGGNADYIVSGDSHLLEMATYKGVRIVTPKTFCEMDGL